MPNPHEPPPHTQTDSYTDQYGYQWSQWESEDGGLYFTAETSPTTDFLPDFHTPW